MQYRQWLCRGSGDSTYTRKAHATREAPVAWSATTNRTPVTDGPGLIEVVSQFASKVAEKARKQQACAGAVHVFITTSQFRKNDKQHSPGVTVPLGRPSADMRVIIQTAVQALTGMYRPGFNYLKAGVMLVDLQPQDQQQGELELFSTEEATSSTAARDLSQLMGAVDALNQRFGRGAVTVASAMHTGSSKTHAGRQERRSPRYTTRLDEIPLVIA